MELTKRGEGKGRVGGRKEEGGEKTEEVEKKTRKKEINKGM